MHNDFSKLWFPPGLLHEREIPESSTMEVMFAVVIIVYVVVFVIVVVPVNDVVVVIVIVVVSAACVLETLDGCSQRTSECRSWPEAKHVRATYAFFLALDQTRSHSTSTCERKLR